MKKVLYLLIALLFSGSMIAQPTINGDISDAEYTTIGTYTSGQNGYGTANNVGKIVAYYSNGTLYFGVSGELGADNHLVIALNFSGYAGRAAGSTLGAGAQGLMQVAKNLDGSALDMETDFILDFNEGNSTTNMYLDAYRFGTTGYLNGAYIETTVNQTGTAKTTSSGVSAAFGGTGSITFAYDSLYLNGANPNKGVEISIPLSAFAGVSNTASVQFFAFIANNSGDFSNECIPGDPGLSNPGGNQNLNAIGGQDFFTSAFTMGSQPGNALNFDGTDDAISIADHNNLDLTSTLTIETWIKPGSGGNTQNIVCKSSSTQNTGYIFPRTDDNWSNIRAYLYIGGWQIISAAYPNDNNWHHTAITYDGSTIKLYIDGELEASSSIAGSVTTNSNVLAIGNQTDYTENYIGSVDEVRIWNTTRTQEQIIENMYTELEGNEAGLVAYYNFDFGIGGGTNTSVTNLYDNGQNGHTGTLSGFALTGTASNWIESDVKLTDATTALSYMGAGNGLVLDGTNDTIAVADNNLIDLTTALTIESWIKPTSGSSVQNVVSKSSNLANNGYIFPRTDNNWTGLHGYLHIVGTGWQVVSTTYPTDNLWHHTALTFDGTTIKLYLDGILKSSLAASGSVTTNANNLTIGNQAGFASEFYSGSVDEIRIWSDARTEAEIRDNMFKRLKGDEANLVAYYTFDAQSGTALTDKTSNALNGTLGGMAGTEWTSATAREAAKAVTSGGNWNTASTWLKGSVPNSSTTDVFVAANITLDADVSAKILNVASGDTLTIGNTYELTTSGNVLNDGVVTIANTGALIQGSSSGLANGGTFNVNKSGTEASGALRYDFWGSPVTSANVSILGALGGNRYWYDPAAATGDLSAGWQAASGTMVVGRGYIATNSGDVTFTGTVNNGEITYAAVTETNSSVNIENIISNPYPSGLDLTLFAAANVSASQLTSSFYFWDDKGTAGNYGTDGYATFNSSGPTWTAAGFAGASAIPSNNIIASGQGFVVVPGASAPASFNVTFTNSMRAANTSTFYRDGSDRQRFWVQLTKDSTHFSEMAVVVNSDATESYDEQFDSKRLDANNASTSINAYYDNTFVVIKSLPAFSSRKQVPLTINIAEDGMYKFAVSKSDNIDGLKIFLFDNLTGMAHLISNNNEHLQLLTAGSYFDRFYLVFDEVENAGTAIEEVHTIQYSITPRDIILTNINEPMSYEVYSSNGQLLEQANLTTNSIDLSTYSTGIYLVKLKTASATETIKFARH